jgi:hypothetical protein
VTRELQGTDEGMTDANHPIDKVRALQRALYFEGASFLVPPLARA